MLRPTDYTLRAGTVRQLPGSSVQRMVDLTVTAVADLPAQLTVADHTGAFVTFRTTWTSPSNTPNVRVNVALMDLGQWIDFYNDSVYPVVINAQTGGGTVAHGNNTVPPGTTVRIFQSKITTPPELIVRGGIAESITGAKIFAPYTDMSLSTLPNFVQIMQESGVKYFTLSFLLGASPARRHWDAPQANAPNSTAKRLVWGTSQDPAAHLDRVRALRAAGGDVCVSFGGETGFELARNATITVSELVEAYASIINAYELNAIDMDIEGAAALADTASINRRNEALRILNDRYPHLAISYCLAVGQSGLLADSLAVLQDANAKGVRLSCVRIMTMSFGASVGTTPLGTVCVNAATAVRAQLQGLGANFSRVTVGIIPMIGQNYPTGGAQRFQLTDVPTVRNFFRNTPWVSHVGWWSTARDNVTLQADLNQINAEYSGVTQEKWEFAKAFLAA